jgi:hypothetical protein
MKDTSVVSRTWQPNPDVVSRRTGETAVLIHMPTGNVFELNTTGARVWDLLSEGLAVETIGERLSVEFDITAAVASAETARLIESLSAAGLITS